MNYLYITKVNIAWNGFDTTSGSMTYAYAYGMFFNALLFYVQVFVLVPRFYIQDRKKVFWLFSVLTLIIVTLCEIYLDYITYKAFVGLTAKTTIAVMVIAWGFHNTTFHILYSIVGFLYRFQYEYFKSEKAKQALEKETHKAELKYLKAQLNPHFLFNGINSVYHLIGTNNTLAKNTLLQFSNLLRYQLYESSSTYISVEKELEYVLQYIKIEEVRKGEDLNLAYNINYENNEKVIAPLLLTSFIENAFKHCSNHTESSKNQIAITIEEQEHKLVLKVNNTYDINEIEEVSNGLGLVNVKRRLALLYPEKHQLSIKKKEGVFSVDLSIDL